jgi:outer membrane biosynthesis protein TonB
MKVKFAYSALLTSTLWAQAAIEPNSPAAVAKPSSCNLGSVSEAKAPIYPVLAKAAHVQGTVVIQTTFAMDGAVTDVVPVRGPEMLRANAIAYVRGWHASNYIAVRSCAVMVEFRLQNENDKPVPLVVRRDGQHVLVNSGVPVVLPAQRSPAVAP